MILKKGKEIAKKKELDTDLKQDALLRKIQQVVCFSMDSCKAIHQDFLLSLKPFILSLFPWTKPKRLQGSSP